MRIYSDDGHEFPDIESCLKHEKQVASDKERRKRLQEEKQNRLEKVKDAYQKADDLAIQFMEDYGHTPFGLSPFSLMDIAEKFL